jgi:para-aminobenzoate synthetase/4-amino-4-deoxychorismate lyase
MAAMPDPRHGVFETLLIVDGRPVELEAHLARLARSLNELFPGHALPDLDQMHVRVKNGAMRIDVAPRADRLDARISFREIEQRSETAALFSLRVPGGLGPHKWRDRSLLDEKQAQLPTRGLPLLLDEDDTALEAARANVFGVREETLLTPPTDGRILPGVTRMRVIELAGEVGIDTYEAELSRADLLTADEVFLTGSVRGIEPAASLDGAVLGAGGPVVAALATELRRAWLGAPVA